MVCDISVIVKPMGSTRIIKERLLEMFRKKLLDAIWSNSGSLQIFLMGLFNTESV